MAALRTYHTWGIGVLFSLAALWPQPTHADEPPPRSELRDSTSLRFVPADAAFFRACLRNEEQLHALLNSRAVQRLKETPSMAQWLDSWHAWWNDPNRGGLRQWLEQPENRELVNFARDALAHEAFWYGDASFADLVDLSAHANQASTSAQLAALRQGRSLADSERIAAHTALRILADNPDRLRVPATVIGFKVTDPDRARRQIARLETTLRSVLRDRAQWLERLRRQEIAGTEFLTWPVDGSMLPWNMVPKSELEQVDPELRRRVEAILQSKRATVSIGVRGDYLLVSLGENNQHLQQLGNGPLLIDRPELAPLRQAAGRPLTSIVYVSHEYRARAATANQHQFYGSFLLEEFLKHPAALREDSQRLIDQETRRELMADIRTLSARLAAAASSQGATLRFSFRTPRGYEGYWYDWSETFQLDGSQPLTVLSHVGGDPLGFLAVRRRVTVEDYDQTVKWLRRAVYYFEKIGFKQMDARRQAAYADLRRQAEPLLAQLDRANRELLIPALADGQAAVVLDAKPPGASEFVSEGDAPSVPTSLPWLNLACVCGVSDAEKFKQGCQEYFAAADQVWSSVRNLIEDVRDVVQARTQAPQKQRFQLPAGDVLRPTLQETAHGELYFYRLPEKWNLDGRVAPNLALSEEFAVMSWLPEYSLRLLESQPLQAGGPLADTDRPLAAAAYLDFAGLIDATELWLLRAWERAEARRREQEQQRLASSEPARAEPRAAVMPPAAAPRVPRSRVAATQTPAPSSARIPPRPAPPPQPAAAPAPQPSPPQPALPRERVVRGQDAATEENTTPRDGRKTFHLVMDVLRCFRGFVCVRYQEDDAMVTHYELRFEDLPELP